MSPKRSRPNNSYRGARRNAARAARKIRNWSIEAKSGQPSVLPASVVKVLRNDQKRLRAGRWFSGKKAI
jgi:hypothetical protein